MASSFLSEDATDDLLYLARTNEATELSTLLTSLVSEHNSSIADIVLTAKDAHSGNNMLHFAAGNGCIDVLNLILTSLPADQRTRIVNEPNGAGNTPLHWAALNGHLDFIKILVKEGNADMDVKNNAGLEPISEADRAEKEEVVLWLLGEQPEPEKMMMRLEKRKGVGVGRRRFNEL